MKDGKCGDSKQSFEAQTPELTQYFITFMYSSHVMYSPHLFVKKNHKAAL